MSNSNPGGPGGRRRKIHVNKARGKTSHRKGGRSMKLPFWFVVIVLVLAVYLIWGLGFSGK